jgi:diguanylate cyclase (GGDEF)-like protein
MPSESLDLAKRPYLVVLSGPQTSDVCEIPEAGELVVGRDDDAPFRLVDAGISRRHARVFRTGSNVNIEDLGSRNGVFVNGHRVERSLLTSGDVIQIGVGTTVQFNLGTPADLEHRRRLAEAAQRDALPGIPNRRSFDEALAGVVSGARRHGSPVSLLVIDVDHFKAVNDTYGHAAGDAVLVTVATALLQDLRREDSLARFGGEEFVVISRDTKLPGALILAERLRVRIEQTPCVYREREIRVTASIGVAELAAEMDETQLFQSADSAVYDAKRSGRNRVSAAKLEAPT